MKSQSRRLFRVWLSACVFGLVGIGNTAYGINDPNLLCPANQDPCTIPSGTYVIDDFANLDFGDRDVILHGTLDVGSNTMSIHARNFTLSGSGRLRANGDSVNSGGNISVDADESIFFNNSSLSPAPVSLTGNPGGELALDAFTGSILSISKISVSNSVIAADAGTMDFVAALDVDLFGPVLGQGGSFGRGSDSSVGLGITAGRDVTLNDLDVSGGEGGGGSFEINAGRNVVIDTVDFRGGGDGDGGEFTVTAVGNITVNGLLRGADGTNLNGTAGTISIVGFEGSSVRINDHLRVQGRGAESCGGSILLGCHSVEIFGDLEIQATTLTGCGGTIEIRADESILLSSTGAMLAEGGSNGESTIDLSSFGTIDLLGPIQADGKGEAGSGGAVSLDALGPVVIDANIFASGASDNDGFGGDVDIVGCTVDIRPGSIIDTKVFLGDIDIAASRQLSITDSTLETDAVFGSIQLRYGDVDTAPILSGSTFTPISTLSLAFDPTVFNCDTDDDGVFNFEDNCRHVVNPDQLDRGGFGFALDPDGIGDLCQCGDVNDDGRVWTDDLIELKAALIGLSAGLATPALCNINGPQDPTITNPLDPAGECGIEDAALLQRALNGYGPPLGTSCGAVLMTP